MREERFRIQCPKHFLVGDSGRFEKSPQGKDSREIPIAQCMSILHQRNTFRFIWTA